MLPDNQAGNREVFNYPVYLSGSPTLLAPHDRPYSPVHAFSMGGLGIQDSSQGLQTHVWEAIINVVGGTSTIVVQREDDTTLNQTMVSTAGAITRLSMSFDQNMNPAVAYQIGNDSYLNWYDATTLSYETLVFNNCITPQIELDDKRVRSGSINDMIFGYLKHDASTNTYDLCYRQQRDRFTIEYTLISNVPPDKKLHYLSMSNENRLIFALCADN